MGDLTVAKTLRSKPTIENVLPLTALQEGLVFHAAYDDRAPDVYNVQLGIDLEGPLNADTLREAAEALLSRHGNLRISVRRRPQGDSVQVVQSHVVLPWTEAVASSGAEAEEIARAERERRFTLSTAPLLRFTLVRLGEERHRFLFTHHHLLLDGWSMPLVMQELFTLYGNRGDTRSLPPAVPYENYFRWLTAQDTPAAENAWRTALADLDEPTRLAPHADSRQSVTPHHRVVSLPPELTRALTGQARRHGLTLNTVVQVAWALLLARLTGREDVIFGTTVSGRSPEVPGIESMIGLFINTLPVRVRLDPTEPLLDLAARLQREQAELSAHQHLGMADIQRLTNTGGELFDTLTVFENYPLDPDALSKAHGLRFTGLHTHNDVHYPLALIALPGHQLTLDLTYRPDLFGESDVDDLVDRYTRVLTTLAEATARLLTHEVGLLTPEEQRRAVEEFNDTAREVPAVAVHELFEEQARRSPEATAIVFEDKEVSYARLNARADDLAHTLRGLGVGPERLVALAVPRSVEMVASMLAVLKTGAAYLPIDPDYPSERIAYMLGDAAPALVVVTEVTQHLAEAAGTPWLLV
ncbi:condensation domain-containing protein [Streptomyces sp. CA-278952]|uniref:condensation domain-containing protein n=1 Tax=Streptomyces sp. CA-278952 TaxID=2980556 RepID=UPI00236767E7|nr:condensation domain-containing protein [Streptomyces sp. CA-278952]WDG32584.1 condensation domain-containing protein [Streptomyces sp. CA-278952]